MGISVFVKMVTSINELPEQVCFPIDGEYLLCNWTHHPTRRGFAIVSNFGKWIKVRIDNIKKQAFNSAKDVKDLNKIG
jgi:hypothetical protein